MSERAHQEHPQHKETSAVVEVSTVGFNLARLGIGSSAYRGDVFSAGLAVPAAASDPNNRYVFRLCAQFVGQNERCEIVSVRTMAVIGGSTTAIGEGARSRFYEREVVSPTWSFPDGNISYHFGFLRGNVHQIAPSYQPSAFPVFPSTSRDIYSDAPALLYQGTSDGQRANPYVAAVLPDFSSVGDTHNIYDQRSPWNEQPSGIIAKSYVGPGLVVCFATVKQTDGLHTPLPEPPLTYGGIGLRPEDQFLLDVPGALYTRLAASMTLRLWRPCLRSIPGGKVA